MAALGNNFINVAVHLGHHQVNPGVAGRRQR